jgi:short-subunit dehydrogenase
MTIDYHAQTVLLTGASSGIGASFAAALAARGSNLVLVARRAQRLASTADGLRRQYGVRVETIPFDLSRPAAGSELREAVADRGVAVTSLINNAVFGTFGPFAESDPERLAAEIAVDAAAPVQLTAAFMPQMLSAAHGFIINVAGVSAYFPSPRMAVYSTGAPENTRRRVTTAARGLAAELPAHTSVHPRCLGRGAAFRHCTNRLGGRPAADPAGGWHRSKALALTGAP